VTSDKSDKLGGDPCSTSEQEISDKLDKLDVAPCLSSEHSSDKSDKLDVDPCLSSEQDRSDKPDKPDVESCSSSEQDISDKSEKPDVDPCSSSEQDGSETSTLTTGIQDIPEPVPEPPKIRNAPTNYLREFRQGVSKNRSAIWGQYFIDLSIPPVPQTVPYVVPAGDENLFLHTASGDIIADVWVTGNNKLRQVSMKLCSDHGSVRAKVHDAFSGNGNEERPSFDIELRANNGTAYVSLPRFFRGLITINSPMEDIAFSPAFEIRTALLSAVQGVRVYFVGDRPRAWMFWGDDVDDKEGLEGADVVKYPEEPLDKLFVSSWNSKVRIRWDGEPETAAKRDSCKTFM